MNATVDLQLIILIVSLANGLGVGKLIHWFFSVEKRLMRIELYCSKSKKECERED